MGDFIFDDHNRFYFSKIGYDYKVPRKSSAEDYKGDREHAPIMWASCFLGYTQMLKLHTS